MADQERSQPHQVQRRTGFAEALRDMFIHATDRGYMIAFGVFCVIALLIYRLDADGAKLVVESLRDGFRTMWLVGYAVAGIATLAWSLHVKVIRRAADKQIKELEKRNRKLEGEARRANKPTQPRRAI